jgi:NADH-quinone oxidoreductase subunit A
MDTLIPIASDPVATLVFFLIVFAVVGAFFLFIHLVMGATIRPNRPDAEKLTIYECGEPTVGSAWVQFDVRYYVVALLFVIFDVEVAFFFPWATVFGKANQLADENLDPAERQHLSAQLLPSGLNKQTKMDMKLATYRTAQGKEGKATEIELATEIKPDDAKAWARVAFFDILVFFGVLLVGFAYVWRRGDIDWVRAYTHHKEPPVEAATPLEQPSPPTAPAPVAVH